MRPINDALKSSQPVVLGVPLLALALTLFAREVLNDGDSWWHIEAGRLMIATRQVLDADPFSHTMPGTPWVTHEWLSEILMAGAHNLAGWAGVLVLTGLAVGLTFWAIAREMGRWLSPLTLACVLAMAFSLWSSHLLARPHILILPVTVSWLLGLMRASDSGRRPAWGFVALMTLWANLHGSFIFGLALIGPFALEALLGAPKNRRIAVVVQWGLFGLACLAASLITPHGVSGLIFPLQVTGMSSLFNIGEWRPADFSKFGPLELVLLVTLFVLFQRQVRVPPVRAALILLLLHMALRHNRYELLLAVVGCLLLAEPLGRAFGREAPDEAPADRRLLLAAGACALALIVARLAVPFVPVSGPTTPVDAVAAVSAEVRARPVLNDYAYGGYLIGQGIKPFIDGRGDMYRDEFLQAYGRIVAPDRVALDAALAKYRIGWTILEAGSPVAMAMDETPGWRRLYADEWTVVHVRAAKGGASF